MGRIVLFVMFFLFTVTAKAQSPEAAMAEVKAYMAELNTAISEIEYMLIIDDDDYNGVDDDGIDEINVGVPEYEKLERLLPLAPKIKKLVEDNWDKLKSSEDITLAEILAGNNEVDIKKRLMEWKYADMDLSLTAVLKCINTVVEQGEIELNGEYFLDKEANNYMDDRIYKNIANSKTAELNAIIDAALALHKSRTK